MGCSSSRQTYAAESGTEAEYKATFAEERTLGQGEFGVVKLVSRRSPPGSDPLAVKVLNKGFVFKDNILYAPMKPEVLKMEIDILRALEGKMYNLALDSVYESSSKVYVVTEACAGGEMLEYVGKNKSDGLRTEDVSRIAHQLLSAVDHCDRRNVLHRDIKPENIMFASNGPTAELRLIDFGCATMDSEKDQRHATFAGTPFYISPEVFQKSYTSRADVFSAGVVLYVLVAGYPAADLQRAFNLLQKNARDLTTLPGMPEDMPQTYFAMLEKLLTYRHGARARAGEVLDDDDFVAFHRDLEEAESRTSSTTDRRRRSSLRKTQSVLLSGTGERAAAAFGFLAFQRAVTTILATMLDRGDILALVAAAEEKARASSADGDADGKLGVIKVTDLKEILEERGNSDCVAAIDKQSNAASYANHSYEYALLRPFAKKHDPGAVVEEAPAEGLSASAHGAARGGATTTAVSTRKMGAGGSSFRKNIRKAQSVYIRGI